MQGRRTEQASGFRPNDGDVLLENVENGDIAILVVGPTAVGKSAFINNVLLKAGSDQTARVGDGRTACTDRLTPYRIKLPGSLPDRHLVLMDDSPGFDHGSVDDAIQLVREIAVWLASLHASSSSLSIGAIVFMYPICRLGRLTNTDIASFRVLCELCGTRNFMRIIPVTTQWDSCDALGDGEKREKYIWSELWKGIWYRNDPIIVHRLRKSNDSASALLRFIVKRSDSLRAHNAPLTIQKEIVTERKGFADTVAAQVLESVLVQKSEYPRRYSIARFVTVLRFRQVIIQIESVMESDSEAEATNVETLLQATVGSDDDSDGGCKEVDFGRNPQQHCSGCNCFQGVEGGEFLEELPARVSHYATAPTTPIQEPLERNPRFSDASSYRTAPLGSTPTTPIAPNVYTASSASFSSSSTTIHHPPASDTGTSSSTTLGGAPSTPQPPPPFEGQYHYQHQEFMPNANQFDTGDLHFHNNPIQAQAYNHIQPRDGGIVVINNHFYCPHGRSWRPTRHATA